MNFMKKKVGQCITGICVAALTLVTMMAADLNRIYAADSDDNTDITIDKVVVDGDLSEWKDITTRVPNNNYMDEWKMAISQDGKLLYFCYSGKTSNEWDYWYLTYSNSIFDVNGNVIFKFDGWKENLVIKFLGYLGINGAEIATVNNANANNPGVYTVEGSIPMSLISGYYDELYFAGTSIAVADIEIFHYEEDTTPPIYEGIVIDGKYSDWDAVTKYDVTCANKSHPECLDKMAMVFDGDYVYLYIKENDGYSAAGAGKYSNGRYSITTDLGKEIQFQLKRNGTVSGVAGAECERLGSEWEISIPASSLPEYTETLSFGFYDGDLIVTDVANLDGSKGEGSFAGIVYDGLYGDWTYYPHTTIQYATGGTHEDVVDGMAALFNDGTTLYGHAYTEYTPHLQEAGGEFTNGVTLDFGNNRRLYLNVVAVDKKGNINWSPKKSELQNGQYEFYLFDASAWRTSTNINNLNKHDINYGKIIMDIDTTKDECEFYVELEKVAEKFQCSASDFKVIKIQFGRIGQQWVATAGASSGAIVGVTMCAGVSAIATLILKKKKKREATF